MSDDLVKRLRAMLEGDMRPSPLGKRAADRIEELEERLENEMQDLDAADRRAKRLQNRIEELEAKMAKAVDVIEWVLIAWDDHHKHGYNMQGDWEPDARTTLAELTSSVAADNQVKGGKHD